MKRELGGPRNSRTQASQSCNKRLNEELDQRAVERTRELAATNEDLRVDDHVVVRDGVKRIFDEQPGEVVFGEASTAQNAIKLVHEENWDAVVLDISLNGRSGLDVLKELKQMRPRLPVLILSMHSEEQYARRAFKAGVAGYQQR